MAKSQDVNIIQSVLLGGKPYKSYIKTILGKVFLQVWDSYVKQPVGVLLQGDPRKKEDSCIIDVWNEEEDIFLTRTNKRQFEIGNILPYTRVQEEAVRTIAEFSDDELLSVINQKFLGFQHALNAIDSVAVLFRMIDIAEKADKSDKITGAIKARLSELQTIKVSEPEE
jgi:hypothetical protein